MACTRASPGRHWWPKGLCLRQPQSRTGHPPKDPLNMAVDSELKVISLSRSSSRVLPHFPAQFPG